LLLLTILRDPSNSKFKKIDHTIVAYPALIVGCWSSLPVGIDAELKLGVVVVASDFEFGIAGDQVSNSKFKINPSWMGH
jgi:hypothetical protein